MWIYIYIFKNKIHRDETSISLSQTIRECKNSITSIRYYSIFVRYLIELPFVVGQHSTLVVVSDWNSFVVVEYNNWHFLSLYYVFVLHVCVPVLLIENLSHENFLRINSKKIDSLMHWLFARN